MLAVQWQSSMHGNNLDSNQMQDMNGPRLNWKVILHFTNVEKRALAQIGPYTGSSVIAQRHHTPLANTQQEESDNK